MQQEQGRDIRWEQRLENLQKSVETLGQALQVQNPDIVQRGGIIQFFEMSFELAWCTLKDYLEFQGWPEVKSPRGAIKKAFEIGLIEDGRAWLNGLEDRNLTSHTYNEETAVKIENLIREKYYPLLRGLVDSLKARKEADD